MTTRPAMFPATLSGLIGAEVSKIETRRCVGGIKKGHVWDSRRGRLIAKAGFQITHRGT